VAQAAAGPGLHDHGIDGQPHDVPLDQRAGLRDEGVGMNRDPIGLLVYVIVFVILVVLLLKLIAVL
jgi:hypothetical protein